MPLGGHNQTSFLLGARKAPVISGQEHFTSVSKLVNYQVLRDGSLVRRKGVRAVEKFNPTIEYTRLLPFADGYLFFFVDKTIGFLKDGTLTNVAVNPLSFTKLNSNLQEVSKEDISFYNSDFTTKVADHVNVIEDIGLINDRLVIAIENFIPLVLVKDGDGYLMKPFSMKNKNDSSSLLRGYSITPEEIKWPTLIEGKETELVIDSKVNLDSGTAKAWLDVKGRSAQGNIKTDVKALKEYLGKPIFFNIVPTQTVNVQKNQSFFRRTLNYGNQISNFTKDAILQLEIANTLLFERKYCLIPHTVVNTRAAEIPYGSDQNILTTDLGYTASLLTNKRSYSLSYSENEDGDFDISVINPYIDGTLFFATASQSVGCRIEFQEQTHESAPALSNIAYDRIISININTSDLVDFADGSTLGLFVGNRQYALDENGKVENLNIAFSDFNNIKIVRGDRTFFGVSGVSEAAADNVHCECYIFEIGAPSVFSTNQSRVSRGIEEPNLKMRSIGGNNLSGELNTVSRAFTNDSNPVTVIGGVLDRSFLARGDKVHLLFLDDELRLGNNIIALLNNGVSDDARLIAASGYGYGSYNSRAVISFFNNLNITPFSEIVRPITTPRTGSRRNSNGDDKRLNDLIDDLLEQLLETSEEPVEEIELPTDELDASLAELINSTLIRNSEAQASIVEGLTNFESTVDDLTRSVAGVNTSLRRTNNSLVQTQNGLAQTARALTSITTALRGVTDILAPLDR